MNRILKIIIILIMAVIRETHAYKSMDNKKTITVDVLSSRWEARVIINDVVVLNETIPKNMGDKEALKTGGLFMIVVNQYNGMVISLRRFKTHYFPDSVGVAPFLYSISPGRIMVMAILMEATMNLSSDVRRLLQQFGSLAIKTIEYRNYFSSVYVVGGHTYSEASNIEDIDLYGEFYSSGLMSSTVIPLQSDSCWQAEHYDRKLFCDQYAGYGSFCDCSQPAPIIQGTKYIGNFTISSVPTAIIAKSRPSALYRCLQTLLSQPGGDNKMIMVFIDGNNKEMQHLLQLMKINYTINDLSGIKMYGASYRIALNYKISFIKIFEIFPDAPATIILEEDLLTAPDFYNYFSQTFPILMKDSGLYCITAWSDLGPMHGSRDIHRVLRVESFPEYGWMLTRMLQEEVLERWPEDKKPYDWDVWMRTFIRFNRECLMPAVSRTFHYSTTGVHVQSALVHSSFTGHLVTVEPYIPLKDLDRLSILEYEEDLMSRLFADDVYLLNTTMHPCKKRFISKNFTNGTVVIFVHMDGVNSDDGWNRLASCTGFWHLDNRLHHRGLVEINYYDTKLVVIGYPFSDYSYLKPSWLKPLPPFSGPKEKLLLGTESMNNRRKFQVPDLLKYNPNMLTDLAVKEPTYVYVKA